MNRKERKWNKHVLIVGCLLVAYFALLLIQIRKAKKETEIELNRARHMLKVEQILYDAHRKPKRFTEALHEIATILSAELAVFAAVKNQKDSRHFIWMEQAEGLDDWQEVDYINVFPTLNAYIERMGEAVARNDYHISVGVACRKDTPLIHEMVRVAEERMYEAKRDYYQTLGEGHNIREKNETLEKILEEKRVLTVFRSIFSSKYLGVYVVNHSADTMQSIYIPLYFERAMKTAGGKFSRAAGIYIQEQVKPEYRQQLQAFVDYEQIENRFQCGEVPELYYQKLDGECVRLQISLSPDYSGHKRECIWTFETVEKVQRKSH